MDSIRELLVNILRRAGMDPGSPAMGRVILAVIVLVILTVLTVVLLRVLLRKSYGRRRGGAALQGPPGERLGGMMGRLEKLERTLNDFKTETLRWQEFCTTELKYLRGVVEEVRDLLSDEGEGGGTAGGGAPRGSQGGAPGGDRGGVEFAAAQDLEQPTPQDIFAGAPMPQLDSGTVHLAHGLQRTREGFFSKIRGIFGRKTRLDAATVDELEAVLIGSDLGVKTSSALINELRAEVSGGQNVSAQAFVQKLKEKILQILGATASAQAAITPPPGVQPFVVMMVGVNGSGKTTSVAKLAHQWKQNGLRVLMVAADTFRAAAADQLAEWAGRIGVPLVRGAEGAKPGAVVFDAMQRARAEQFDVVVIDTAGRLHTKTSLMQELEGLRNIVARHNDKAPHETILVLDGSTGQNALAQAKEFHAAVPLTGVIVTKLDGTPKGGIVVAIKDELGVPVRYIGVGESKEDLRVFNPVEFVDAMFASKAQVEGDGADRGSSPMSMLM